MSKIGNYVLEQLEAGYTMEEIAENGIVEQAKA